MTLMATKLIQAQDDLDERRCVLRAEAGAHGLREHDGAGLSRYFIGRPALFGGLLAGLPAGGTLPLVSTFSMSTFARGIDSDSK